VLTLCGRPPRRHRPVVLPLGPMPDTNGAERRPAPPPPINRSEQVGDPYRSSAAGVDVHVQPEKPVADHQLGRMSEFGRPDQRRRSRRLLMVRGCRSTTILSISQRMPAALKPRSCSASGREKGMIPRPFCAMGGQIHHRSDDDALIGQLGLAFRQSQSRHGYPIHRPPCLVARPWIARASRTSFATAPRRSRRD
jgi:hypothetical protein